MTEEEAWAINHANRKAVKSQQINLGIAAAASLAGLVGTGIAVAGENTDTGSAVGYMIGKTADVGLQLAKAYAEVNASKASADACAVVKVPVPPKPTRDDAEPNRTGDLPGDVKTGMGIGGILLLVAAAGGAYWVFFKK